MMIENLRTPLNLLEQEIGRGGRVRQSSPILREFDLKPHPSAKTQLMVMKKGSKKMLALLTPKPRAGLKKTPWEITTVERGRRGRDVGESLGVFSYKETALAALKDHLASKDEDVSGGSWLSEAGDKTSARELELYIDNTQQHYRQKVAIFQNLQKKIKRGKFDRALAIKGLMHVVDAGARAYTKEHGSPGARPRDMFDRATRTMVAKEFLEEFEAEIEAGNSW